MLMLPSDIKVWVAAKAVDMRKGFHTLAAMVEADFKLNAKSGQLFVFFGRSKSKVKIVYWDRNGFVLWYKSLAQGRFRPPQLPATHYHVSVSDLTLLLEGIDLIHHQRLQSV